MLNHADLVEEQELKEKILEVALIVGKFQVLDNGHMVDDNYQQNSNWRLQKHLNNLNKVVGDYQIVRNRNETARMEEYAKRY